MRSPARLLSLPLALLAVSPAIARGDLPPQTITIPTGAPAPAPNAIPTGAPEPAPITIHAGLENQGGVPVDAVIAGGRVRVAGTVRPYIGDQQIFVRTYRQGRKLETRAVPVVNGGNGVGRFSALIGVGGRPASVSVSVSHPATSLQSATRLPALRLPAVRATVALGEQSGAAHLLQEELAALHYAVPRSGRFDDATARAVVAFRKLTDLPRTDQANRVVFERLASGAGGFRVRNPGQGAHFEADLTHQVLAEVLAGGRVRQIFEMSSGKPSTPTVIGNFSIYMKTIGTNAKGMVDANYFIGGYAIHGYADVPTYPASHGCLRIPVPDAGAVYAWARFGYPVDVYYRSGGGSHQVRGNAGP